MECVFCQGLEAVCPYMPSGAVLMKRKRIPRESSDIVAPTGFSDPSSFLLVRGKSKASCPTSSFYLRMKGSPGSSMSARDR